MKFDFIQSISLTIKQTFKFKGTSSRPDFIAGLLTYIVMYAIYSRVQSAIMRAHLAGHASTTALIFMLIFAVLMILASISTVSLSSRRLRDAGFSGRWAILAFLYNLLTGAVFFFGVVQNGVYVTIGYGFFFLTGVIPPLAVLAMCLFFKTKIPDAREASNPLSPSDDGDKAE